MIFNSSLKDTSAWNLCEKMESQTLESVKNALQALGSPPLSKCRRGHLVTLINRLLPSLQPELMTVEDMRGAIKAYDEEQAIEEAAKRLSQISLAPRSRTEQELLQKQRDSVAKKHGSNKMPVRGTTGTEQSDDDVCKRPTASSAAAAGPDPLPEKEEAPLGGSGMRIQRRIMCYCRIWATAYRAGPQTRHPNQVFLRCGLGFRHPTKCDFFLWGSAVPDLKIYDPSTSEKDMVEENPGASASAPPTPVPIPVPTTEDKQTSINGDDQEMTDGRNKVRVKRSF